MNEARAKVIGSPNDMPTYIAMLRAVNVGGQTVSMERLRQWFTDLGFGQVRTYIQSGNVIFDAGKPPSACAGAIESRLAAELGAPVSVILKTPAELAEIIARNPFLKDPAIDRSKLHVTFLSQAPAPAALQKLAQVEAGPDAFRAVGSEIYVYCPNGYGRTRLSNMAIERVLALRATTRNWNTVNKLYGLAGASSALRSADTEAVRR